MSNKSHFFQAGGRVGWRSGKQGEKIRDRIKKRKWWYVHEWKAERGKRKGKRWSIRKRKGRKWMNEAQRWIKERRETG